MGHVLGNVGHVRSPVAPDLVRAGACTGHTDGDGGAGAGGDAVVVGAGDPGDVVPPWSVAGDVRSHAGVADGRVRVGVKLVPETPEIACPCGVLVGESHGIQRLCWEEDLPGC